jgi:hypothetical protein
VSRQDKLTKVSPDFTALEVVPGHTSLKAIDALKAKSTNKEGSK